MAMIIGIVLILKDGNIFLGLVLIWASYGILVARSQEAMNGDSIVAAVSLITMSGLLLSMLGRLLLIRKYKKQSEH